jgi:DNA (cytosine-5)-methyltransferase 1
VRGPLRFGSVCSGIEAASAAWEPLGWQPAWFAEIDAFPSAVLAHHYPGVPNLGDMTRLPALILAGEVEAPDVFVGGTPCQSFSVAGLRKGLDDPRGQLTRSFVEIADAIDTVRATQGLPPAIILWENVPGVLSDNGNAFGNFLGALAGEDIALDPSGAKWTNAGLVLGPTREVCWRVLDAQYFGVAQRRRRVFVVAGSRTGGVRASQVLLVESGVRRDSPPSREAGQRPAPTLAARTRGGGGLGTDFDLDGGLVADGAGRHGGVVIAPPLTATNDPSRSPQSAEVTAQVHAVLQAQTIAHVDVVGTLSDGAHNGGGLNGQDAYTGRILPVAFDARQAAEEDGTGRGTPIVPMAFNGYQRAESDAAWPIMASDARKIEIGVRQDMAVRRLTPRECERLQGFPDDYTRIPWKKKPADECPDGPRYKALGNSMAVPCMNWLGRKIDKEYRKRHEAL